ncbi:hypothetical protein BCR36DRAFT_323420 [Piromyces finnis]|uniref:N-acetyltransferase domain-containing protein n=1 Tax=Piromyces finnis TaxID=1754191 RepID=A0A1Y1VDV7_9FUNG|nr:hypothetical protein BCR36DRAFT_323420 [Piromyces finnis]|eukprot:ORX53294.1 hypothetical protein BCR36DRAFT_323420 [Piromyces finnis]
MKENNSEIYNSPLNNNNNSIQLNLNSNLQCTISLLHDTPISPNKALYKAFHLVNKEWPLTNSGALLQRLKLIGSSHNLFNTNVECNISNEYTNNKAESKSISNINSSLSNSNKTDFHFVYNNIPKDQLPYLLPFSVVAYLENKNDNSEVAKISKENELIKEKDIRIIGHSRWASAQPVFSKNTNSKQVIMDSLVVDKDYRNYGIGKAILLYGEQILKKMNVNQIYLQTKYAKNFYLKYEYEESKILPTIKVDKKIYDNIPLNDECVEKVIENELSLDKTLKPRPFDFSNAIWMEKKITA